MLRLLFKESVVDVGYEFPHLLVSGTENLQILSFDHGVALSVFELPGTILSQIGLPDDPILLRALAKQFAEVDLSFIFFGHELDRILI